MRYWTLKLMAKNYQKYILKWLILNGNYDFLIFIVK